MATRAIPLIDRLQERGLIDRWGFLLFAFGGSALIIVSKVLAVSSVAVAALAGICLVAYAGIVDRLGGGRLRSDQAGDNCYYLGLIYTLASLAYAIFFFDPADTATTIVQGFGVALATTIIGLVLRVFFNQSRVDLVETEDTARLELADAAGRLKAELSHIVVSLNDFSTQTRQSLEEMRNASVQQVTTALESALATIDTVTTNAQRAAETQADEAMTRAKQLTSAAGRVTTSLEKHGASVERLGSTNDSIAASLIAVEQAARQTREGLETLATQSDRLRTRQLDLQAGSANIGRATEQLLAVVTNFSTSVLETQDEVRRRLQEVEQAPQAVLQQAINSIEQSTQHLKQEFEGLTDAHKRAADALAAQSFNAVEAAQRHNAALDEELSRSRESVGKVHTALVEMTGDLVRRVNNPALQ